MFMGELPFAPIARIIKKSGAERVSDKAVIALAEILEEIAEDISREAVALSKHAKRKTVNDKDIKLAST